MLGAACLAIPGIWAAGVTAREAGLKDPQIVVVDEVVGQWITLAGADRVQLEELAAGVRAVPRLRYLEASAGAPARTFAGRNRHRADDAMAGVYAALVLFAAGWFNLY